MKNLFICFTPFHLNLSYSIIKQMNYENNVLVFLPSVQNNKNNNYFENSKIHFRQSFTKIIKKNYISDYLYLNNISGDIQNVDRILVGNLKTIYSRILISKINCNEIFTFDDGVGHFYKSKYFFSFDKKIIDRLLVKSAFYYSNLFSNVKTHFSLYSNNFMKQRIILIKYRSVMNIGVIRDKGKNLSLFLSRPFYEEGIMPQEKVRRLYDKIIGTNEVNYIQMHPREKNNYTILPILNDSLIVEDLVLSGSINKLIGFSTTSLITAKILNSRIECIYYYLSHDPVLDDLFAKLEIKRIKIS